MSREELKASALNKGVHQMMCYFGKTVSRSFPEIVLLICPFVFSQTAAAKPTGTRSLP